VKKIIVEICCSSIQSVEKAVEGKADRIELCQNLLVDGLSPSSELLEKATLICNLPIHVLIRPRAGDFNYNDKEIEQIEKDIERVKKFPIQGIVIGALDKENYLALEHLRKWRNMCPDLNLTFHRAFDVVKDPEKAIAQLIELKYDRILTSGQEAKAADGLKLLQKLNSKFLDKITIMPGGGINDVNVNEFLNSGFNEIHLSAKNKVTATDPIANLKIIQSVMSTASNYK
tara:strand:+ start:5764 stop:6453 length:690 start_codon:yes stop_codon:yes gene_type:complete